MTRDNARLEKANSYDKNELMKSEVNNILRLLKEFRIKFPFTENLRAIEWLDPDKLFKVNPDQVGEFFQFLDGPLKSLGNLNQNSSNVYRNARLQIGDFKNLLRVVVDKRKSLAEKVDAPWEKIGGLGQDKLLAKKIIYCFNYESGAVLPIFSTQHLRHFVNRVVDAPSSQTKYCSLGQEYAQYTNELLKVKDSLPVTHAWETLYFATFLYNAYPPPDSEKPTLNPSGERKTINVVTNEQLELGAFVRLLGELQAKGKITGQEFRENRELWMKQQPNDRDIMIWRLKQLLNPQPEKTNPRKPQSDEPPKRPTRQKL
ncbi:MAG TPA: hypothetical protein VK209_06635 [Candidatus Sulfotelmatobacter sp.]|nr:hypothetical protein [Candidatus Sulfotelmatobacter sp.]